MSKKPYRPMSASQVFGMVVAATHHARQSGRAFVAEWGRIQDIDLHDMADLRRRIRAEHRWENRLLDRIERKGARDG